MKTINELSSEKEELKKSLNFIKLSSNEQINAFIVYICALQTRVFLNIPIKSETIKGYAVDYEEIYDEIKYIIESKKTDTLNLVLKTLDESYVGTNLVFQKTTENLIEGLRKSRLNNSGDYDLQKTA